MRHERRPAFIAGRFRQRANSHFRHYIVLISNLVAPVARGSFGQSLICIARKS